MIPINSKGPLIYAWQVRKLWFHVAWLRWREPTHILLGIGANCAGRLWQTIISHLAVIDWCGLLITAISLSVWADIYKRTRRRPHSALELLPLVPLRRRVTGYRRAGLWNRHPLLSLHGVGGVSGFWEAPSRLLAIRLHHRRLRLHRLCLHRLIRHCITYRRSASL